VSPPDLTAKVAPATSERLIEELSLQLARAEAQLREQETLAKVQALNVIRAINLFEDGNWYEGRRR